MRTMPRLALSLAVASCTASSTRAPAVPTQATVAAPTASSWTTVLREANALLGAHDYRSYRARLAGLYRISGSSQLLLGLARADARVGDREAAIAHLYEYAAMGIYTDIDASESLAPLKDDARWPALRARLEANRTPVAHVTTQVPLPHEDLVAEGLAWSATSGAFLVSSVHQRKILAVDARGEARNFVVAAAGEGTFSAIVSDGRSLWATIAALPPMVGFDAKARHPTALAAFDLATGASLTRVELPDDGREHALTDLAVSAGGDVYVSDSPGGMVYTLARGASKLVPLVADGELLSPQTPAVSADGRRLYVPDYVRGIAVIDLASRALDWL
ncbi:MAG TPA: hypothetical protein VIF09_16345, partial [Polyangiaceae bacterium]